MRNQQSVRPITDNDTTTTNESEKSHFSLSLVVTIDNLDKITRPDGGDRDWPPPPPSSRHRARLYSPAVAVQPSTRVPLGQAEPEETSCRTT